MYELYEDVIIKSLSMPGTVIERWQMEDKMIYLVETNEADSSGEVLHEVEAIDLEAA